jgi:hypothetical protein
MAGLPDTGAARENKSSEYQSMNRGWLNAKEKLQFAKMDKKRLAILPMLVVRYSNSVK